jgi:hypothetical protein
MKIKSKIGYCDNKTLGIKSQGGHYVYIHNFNGNGTCDVNVVTSLEDTNSNYNLKKLKQVKRGNTYPIPKYDANFSRWSGINKNVIKNIPLSSIKNIGIKKVKQRHKFYIGKYCK